MKQCYLCKEYKQLSEFNRNQTKKDGLEHRCKDCRKILWAQSHPKKIKYTIPEQKRCSKCKIYKSHEEFSKEQDSSDGFCCRCKSCSKEYKIKNKEKIVEQNKMYRITHREAIRLKDQRYNILLAKFSVFAHQLTMEEEPRRAEDGVSLEVRCKYCNKYFSPTNIEVSHRIQAIYGTISGSQHLYCSEECKNLCSTFRKKEWPEGLAPITSREVDPLLRKMCFELDEWECQRCGKTESLICHHILGYTQYKTLGNDIVNTITFCEECHKWVHSFKGCRFVDLRCKLEA